MLPSKGYFNSLECPFYLSSTNCIRPYCHFKHPKRDINVENVEAKENSMEGNLVNAKSQLPLPTVTKPPPPAPVKHIPIAYIPTKPSAISVNTKKPKSVVPNVKNNAPSKNVLGPSDYDPLSIMDTVEKTYSRYSYEKQDYDSEDELFKPLFNSAKNAVCDTNHIGKSEDGSRSCEDDETDDYPDGAEFSPPISPKDEEEEMEFKEESTEAEELSDFKLKLSSIKKEPDLSDNVNKEIKCKKKRKYNEAMNAKNSEDSKVKSQNVAFDKISVKTEENENLNVTLSKKIKIEEESNHVDERKTEKKICKRKRTADGAKLTGEQDDKHSSDSKKHSSSSKKYVSEKKIPDNKHSSKSHSSDHKSSDASKKLSTTDSKKSSSDKKSSSSGSQKNSDIKKQESKSSDGSKKSSSSDKHSSKHHSSDNKLHSSDNKQHTSKSKYQSSDDKHHSSDDKHHSSDNKHHSSGKHRSSSESKKHQVSDEKSKDSKNKDGSSRASIKDNKNKSNERKQQDKNKKHSEKKKEHNSNIKNSIKHSSGHSKDGKTKSGRDSSSCEKDKSKSRSKGRNMESSDISGSESERKETILISDSSNNEESDYSSRRYDSPVDIDEIFGSSSGSDREVYTNHHHISESENEEEYTPKPVHSSKPSPVYTPASKEYLDEMKQKFKLAQSASTEEYKPVQTVSKVRIAHVPNVSSLISAKQLISSGRNVPSALQKIVTATHVINNPRAQNRTLVHNASTSRTRPQITTNLDSIIALSIRQPGLNNIFDEFLKFISYDEACRRAVDEETEICNIATNPQSYRNRIALCILRIRKSKGAVDVVKKEKITSNSKPDYTYGLTLYECFSKYLLKPEDYVLHGFPLELPGKAGCVYIDKNSYFRNKHTGPREGPYRKCCNCGQEYAVDDETEMPLTKNDCYHHWGKPIGMGRLGKIYTCCKAEVGSEPCHISLYHVTETKNDDCLEGFVRTRPYPTDADPNKAGIYAMDCEMCFTTKGRDIVRVSLLSIDNETVYDVLIKPKYPVLDYCTRFSGITEEKLANVTTSLEEVQKFVLKMINDKTILVGHSLENDLKALKLIHYTVVDTSLMFPHKEGLPVKCALRTLTSRILGQAIQTGENGHDSLEDARASLQLVLHQVKEDAKSRKPRVVKQLKSK